MAHPPLVIQMVYMIAYYWHKVELIPKYSPWVDWNSLVSFLVVRIGGIAV